MRRTFTRLGAVLASTLVAGAFVAGPAGAAGRAEAFLGNATGTALNQVIAPVQSALEQVFGPLAQAAPQIKPATDTISTLLTDLAKTQTLSVRLGTSTSDVSVTGTQVTSVSTAAGGKIELFPVGG